MNDLDYVIIMLKTSNKAAVAKEVGLSARTVRAVAAGIQKHPSFETIRKLAEHFRNRGVK